MLSHIKVLDFCWIGAGAFVTRILSDLGADVIKVESRTHPDNLRLSGPHAPGAAHLEGSGYFASRNTGKRSLALNMSKPEARALARSLAMKSALVTNNFRPGIMEKWSLDYASLRRDHPSLVYLSMPMQGKIGPHKKFVGFGSTIAALCGLVEMAGLPGRPPIGTGTHFPDHLPNPGHALVAVLAALYHVEETGEGQEIELAQIESTINFLGPQVLAHSAGRPGTAAQGNRKPGSVPRGVYPCRGEDSWCAVEVETDAQWRALCRILGRADWQADAGLASVDGRTARQDEIDAALAGITSGFAAGEFADLLTRAGVPAAAVANTADVLKDPTLASRRFWHEVPHPEMGSLIANTPPFQEVGAARAQPGTAPLLGQHTKEIVSEMLGIEEAEYRRLVDEEILF